MVPATNWDSAESYSIPASVTALRTASRSEGSLMTSKDSGPSTTSSAPASSTAMRMESSSTPSALAISTTPLREKL